MNNIDEGGLVSIAQEDALPTSLRAKAWFYSEIRTVKAGRKSNLLPCISLSRPSTWMSWLLILLEDELAIPTHPFETLLSPIF